MEGCSSLSLKIGVRVLKRHILRIQHPPKRAPSTKMAYAMTAAVIRQHVSRHAMPSVPQPSCCRRRFERRFRSMAVGSSLAAACHLRFMSFNADMRSPLAGVSSGRTSESLLEPWRRRGVLRTIVAKSGAAPLDAGLLPVADSAAGAFSSGGTSDAALLPGAAAATGTFSSGCARSSSTVRAAGVGTTARADAFLRKTIWIHQILQLHHREIS